MPLNPAAPTTAGQFAASMLVSRAASRSGLAPATGLVAATEVVPAGGLVRATGPVRETEVVPATDGVLAMLTVFDGCAAASGRNANMRSKVISKPIRGSGAMFKSRRPASAIW